MAEIQTTVNSYKEKISEMQQAQQQEQLQQEQQQQQQQQEQQEQQQAQETENPVKEEENKEQKEETPQQTPTDSTPQPTNQQQEKTPKQNSLKDPFENYEQLVKCVKLEENEITNRKDLFITICEPEKVKLGLFSAAYYQYSVKTAPVNYNVKRKVDDFTFLYSKLPLLNPGVFKQIYGAFTPPNTSNPASCSPPLMAAAFFM